jgi:hypothetical protein
LTELKELEDGDTFSKYFKASLITWHQAHMQVETHSADASVPKRKGK